MSPPRHKSPWTDEEDRELAWRWAQVDLYRIAQRHGRTEAALANRAQRLRLPNAAQGYLSLRAVSDLLGYDPEVVRVLARRLGVSLRRQPYTLPGRTRGDTRLRHFAITDEQLAELTAELDRLGWPKKPNRTSLEGVWNTGGKPPACRRCGCIDRPHVTRGLCSRCRRRSRKDGTLEEYHPIRRKQLTKKMSL